MRIDFTRKQYRTLIELLHLADWMLHAHHVEEPPETADYRAVIQMIMSHYKAMSCEDVLERTPRALISTRALEDQMWPLINAYDRATFWEQIASRLAERDAEASAGHKRYEEMSSEERFALIDDHRERWEDEFEQYALTRLTVRDTRSDISYQVHVN